MSIKLRFLIVLVLVAAIAAIARSNVAWAGAVGTSGMAIQQQEQFSPASDKPDPGSVRPPSGDLTVCEEGSRSVGGVSTLEVTDLAPGYCIVAFLRNHAFAVGRIPDGAGSVLAHITFLRVFYHGRLIQELPEEDGRVEICYAVPPGKTAQIYFFNFYGPRFGDRTGQPSWEPLETTLDGSVACAAAQISGAYALIGK
jgi:hypothetical protein